MVFACDVVLNPCTSAPVGSSPIPGSGRPARRSHGSMARESHCYSQTGKQLVRVIDSRLQIFRHDLHAGFFQYARVVPRYGKEFDAARNPLAPS
jgi:hypothetical protein